MPNVVRGQFGRVYSPPGGGVEMEFPYPIPREIPQDRTVSEDIMALWSNEREQIDREARAQRDSQVALFELFDLYDQLAVGEQEQVDQLLAEWAMAEDEALRFDALALISEKRIVTALPSPEVLLVRLRTSASLGAPYEAEKVQAIIDQF